jgi:amino acid adenylation domain-containing protein
MDASEELGRGPWRQVLRAGGSSTIARWTRDPESGVAEHETAVPGEVAGTLRGLADELGLSLSAVLLAAHAKVLSALTGEAELTTGLVNRPGGSAVPCRLSAAPGSWRALVWRTHRIESATRELPELPNGALDGLLGEFGLPGMPFETVFDPTGADSDLDDGDLDDGDLDDGDLDDGDLDDGDLDDGDLDAGTVLRVGVSDREGGLALRLRYRTEEFDAATAARIAGYHLTALTLIAADPGADHTAADLLAGDELAFQLDGLAGPDRELPDCRPHELFEQRVAAHPDRVAAVHAGREWTYRELNSRANQLAQALLSRGLRREGVVAVVTERNLDWMAAVLAVFKAGGVYLPIEPHFPSDRIATTLRRAGCQLVLTESASTTTLEPALAALPGVPSLFIEQCYGEGHADGDLGLEITPDQLAYVYFTSGSTGEPKGAMCEQAGMLNHLFAKIDDLRIGDGSVVAQTAPQCFDISLWQLISAVLVGGRTLLIEQDVVLDVERFVDTVVNGRVSVLQIVPSYLEVVLTYLEQHPRELPDLRCVSVTGEALKKELTQRWFAAESGIVLVNAYGLTETSDDTNHAVLDRVPERAGVPLGPCVNNVRVYIVDEHLRPVPLGAPGEIVFSGVCVGRGYINDPDRTAAAFMTDPHRAGERLYRSGDFGRWAPDGNLEFLGRRDAQVKISGFRIEIGEIENTLLRVPGVRDGAVVVAERADGGKYLVAFYAGPAPLDVDALRERLGESLPVYMVPTAVHWRESLPLTANSKIDKKALRVLAAELDASRGSAGESGSDAAASDDERAPASPNERRLAEAWAKVLGVGVDQIGRHDHFFDRGGTSLLAVKLAIALKREVSLKDLTRHPVLADLAALLDGRQAAESHLDVRSLTAAR